MDNQRLVDSPKDLLGSLRSTLGLSDEQFQFLEQALLSRLDSSQRSKYETDGNSEEPPRAYLGVTLEEDGHGARIGSVQSDSAASQAGLREGDVIIRFDGIGGMNERGIRGHIGRLQPGSRIWISVSRDGVELTLEATLGSR